MDYLATPNGAGPWPAVVVVHELFGLTDDIKAKADRLAANGYLALAIDLYNGKSAKRCMMSAFRQLAAGSGPMFDMIDAGRRGLLESSDCIGRVGVIGFCMGGGFALVAAPRGFDVAAVNYGQLPKDLDATLRGACPVVGSYGADDPTLRKAAAKLDESLTRLDIPHDVKEYPDASHAYMSEEKPAWVMQKLMGLKFVPGATTDTWARIDSYFAKYLSNA